MKFLLVTLCQYAVTRSSVLLRRCDSSNHRLNSLQNDTILDRLKLKEFADGTINVTAILKYGLLKVENIEGKGENAGKQHFLLFPQCFQKASFSGSLKVVIVWIDPLPDDKILDWSKLKAFCGRQSKCG